ncbi:hypothetical protein ABW20_dc0101707 [Dactylellina cionopaga]|nr:hypothetical protein ABW20_dc0101707 [Dactylellina cionopaga]
MTVQKFLFSFITLLSLVADKASTSPVKHELQKRVRPTPDLAASFPLQNHKDLPLVKPLEDGLQLDIECYWRTQVNQPAYIYFTSESGVTDDRTLSIKFPGTSNSRIKFSTTIGGVIVGPEIDGPFVDSVIWPANPSPNTGFGKIKFSVQHDVGAPPPAGEVNGHYQVSFYNPQGNLAIFYFFPRPNFTIKANLPSWKSNYINLENSFEGALGTRPLSSEVVVNYKGATYS